MNTGAGVNLLSPSYVAKRSAKQALARWSFITAVGLALVGLWVGYEYYALQQVKARLAYAEAEHGKQEKAKGEIDRLTKMRSMLEQREQATFELEGDVPLIDLVGIVSRAARDRDGSINLQKFQYGAAAAAGSRSADVGFRSLKLVGVAKDNVAIARFAASIRDTKVFDAVELASTGPATGTTDASHRQFNIQCSLAADSGGSDL